ncbi:hypothetical protein BC937DRAFT_93991 [Endogone sp. FLAS-F59071]|nr:hypothetical protein BC937DRAFT_93991 [Endogone sp. FLAS-F59071]|eukprot:RUS14332.1 hypothetical protein BC937DRAFT_93991 [Endogone sp. FLAS-F59071]
MTVEDLKMHKEIRNKKENTHLRPDLDSAIRFRLPHLHHILGCQYQQFKKQFNRVPPFGLACHLLVPHHGILSRFLPLPKLALQHFHCPHSTFAKSLRRRSRSGSARLGFTHCCGFRGLLRLLLVSLLSIKQIMQRTRLGSVIGTTWAGGIRNMLILGFALGFGRGCRSDVALENEAGNWVTLLTEMKNNQSHHTTNHIMNCLKILPTSNISSPCPSYIGSSGAKLSPIGSSSSSSPTGTRASSSSSSSFSSSSSSSCPFSSFASLAALPSLPAAIGRLILRSNSPRSSGTRPAGALRSRWYRAPWRSMSRRSMSLRVGGRKFQLTATTMSEVSAIWLLILSCGSSVTLSTINFLLLCGATVATVVAGVTAGRGVSSSNMILSGVPNPAPMSFSGCNGVKTANPSSAFPLSSSSPSSPSSPPSSSILCNGASRSISSTSSPASPSSAVNGSSSARATGNASRPLTSPALKILGSSNVTSSRSLPFSPIRSSMSSDCSGAASRPTSTSTSSIASSSTGASSRSPRVIGPRSSSSPRSKCMSRASSVSGTCERRSSPPNIMRGSKSVSRETVSLRVMS